MQEQSADERSKFIVETCRELGFHRIGLVPIELPERYDKYEDWLTGDMHGTMDYMASESHRDSRKDIRTLLPSAKTMVVVALAYAKNGGDLIPKDRLAGKIARFARGRDYHAVFKQRLKILAARIESHSSCKVLSRACVDSAPILERDFAERAKIGFVAKNTMLIAPGLGSYILLGELILDSEATPTAEARETPRCGECTKCLDACPTGAFANPYVLDARKCISYLTIESREPIPRALREPMGNMIFGCDICQEVCPFNQRAPDRHEPDPELMPRSQDAGVPDLLALAKLGSNQRKRWVHDTPMRRINREQLLRNICVALGNSKSPEAIPTLVELATDRAALVRGHAAWALGQLSSLPETRGMIRATLLKAAASEEASWVQEELALAIEAAA